MALSVNDIIELRQRLAAGTDGIRQEIMAETAGSLGHQGRMVEKTMAALRAFEGPAEERVALVRAAAKAVYAYFVQREACGMRNHRDVIQFYGIPGEVLVRLGAIEK
jgi:hypothetical protein